MLFELRDSHPPSLAYGPTPNAISGYFRIVVERSSHHRDASLPMIAQYQIAVTIHISL